MAEKHHLKLVLNWFGHYASGDGTIYASLTGDLYAPMYIVKDEETYPRAVAGDGVVHHNHPDPPPHLTFRHEVFPIFRTPGTVSVVIRASIEKSVLMGL
jgi:hypothetical protein